MSASDEPEHKPDQVGSKKPRVPSLAKRDAHGSKKAGDTRAEVKKSRKRTEAPAVAPSDVPVQKKPKEALGGDTDAKDLTGPSGSSAPSPKVPPSQKRRAKKTRWTQRKAAKTTAFKSPAAKTTDKKTPATKSPGKKSPAAQSPAATSDAKKTRRRRTIKRISTIELDFLWR